MVKRHFFVDYNAQVAKLVFMMQINELTHYLDNLLQITQFEDYCPNGLQVEGKSEIKKIAFAVSATKASIQAAANWQADALIVHHGLFWKFHGTKTLTGAFAKRVKPLIHSEINLLGYHLPLDAHIELGNAATLAQKLSLQKLKPFGNHKGSPTGVQGQLAAPLEISKLQASLTQILDHPVIISKPDEAKLIQTIGIITGGANSDWALAKAAGLDAYITGEMSEHDWHEAGEAGIYFLAGGHHATEKLGIQNLMQHLKIEFPKIEMQFIDSANPA